MLKFVSSYLALSYLAFAALGVLGVLQALAAWHSLVGFALLDYGRSPWRRALGPLLIVIAYVWFFGTRREILTPGPAGGELTILFGGAVLLALAVTLLGASILRPHRPRAAGLAAGIEARVVPPDQGPPGLLLTRAGQAEAAPGVCLVSDPGIAAAWLHPLAAALAAEGYVVVVPDWGAAPAQGSEIRALVPSALAFLTGHPGVDPSQLAVVGLGLGADVALRAAVGEPRLRAVIALAPLLDGCSARPGAGLLCEMTYVEAVRWGLSGLRSPILSELRSGEAIAGLASRLVLVAYGSHDPIVPLAAVRGLLTDIAPKVQVRSVPSEGHVSLAQSAATVALVIRWLAECMKQ